MKTTMQKINEMNEAYRAIIAEMRAMGLDEAFIATFIDNGKANDIADNLIKRNARKAH